MGAACAAFLVLPHGLPKGWPYLLVLFVLEHVLDGLIQVLYMKLKGKNTGIQIKRNRLLGPPQ